MQKTISVDTIKAIMDYCNGRRLANSLPLFCKEGVVWLNQHEVIGVDDACEDIHATDYFLWTVWMYSDYLPEYKEWRSEYDMIDTPTLRERWDEIVETLEAVCTAVN